ncbi:hypothetical protein D6745_00260 [Candidatus Woesearchaeota archaeon]|nr:MAG: hypothetical protein D6745_00260 [Candidatus Woesearchaeota archaeon]
MARKLKHDRYVEALCEIIKSEYDEIILNIPLYSKRKRKVAEIDILARKGKDYDAYEVKCSYRILKAKKQLRKIKKLLPNINNLFFFCGESGKLEAII